MDEHMTIIVEGVSMREAKITVQNLGEDYEFRITLNASSPTESGINRPLELIKELLLEQIEDMEKDQ